MGATSTTTVTLPDPSACPTGNLFYNAIQWVDSHISTTTTLDAGTGIQIVRQSSTPAPTPNIIWSRIGSTGGVSDPQGQYVYFNGRWVRDVSYDIGDILPTYFDVNGYVDTGGKGLFVPVSPAADTPNIAGPMFGWQLCNGMNGSVNLKNRFPMAGYQFTEGVGWVASVKDPAPATTYSDQPNGGREGITITLPELPVIPIQEYDSTQTNSSSALYGGVKWNSATAAGSINFAQGVQQAIQPINPLYRVIGFKQFIGYYAASQS